MTGSALGSNPTKGDMLLFFCRFGLSSSSTNNYVLRGNESTGFDFLPGSVAEMSATPCGE